MYALLLNVVIWGLVVYSFRIAWAGRLSIRVLATAPPATVELAADLFQREQSLSDASDEVHELLSNLAQVRLLAFVIVLVEYVLCIYFFRNDPRDPVPWFIIVKNLLITVMVIRARNETMDLDPIQALLSTPKWIRRWERLMNLVTGLCLLFQFGRLNFGV